MTLIGSTSVLDFFYSDRVGTIIFFMLVVIFLELITSGIMIGVQLSHLQGIDTYLKVIDGGL